MQDQIDGLVVGVRQTVAEEAARPVEAGHGVAKPVTYGDELTQRAVLVFVVVFVVFHGGVVGHALSDTFNRFSRVRR